MKPLNAQIRRGGDEELPACCGGVKTWSRWTLLSGDGVRPGMRATELENGDVNTLPRWEFDQLNLHVTWLDGLVSEGIHGRCRLWDTERFDAGSWATGWYSRKRWDTELDSRTILLV